LNTKQTTPSYAGGGGFFIALDAIGLAVEVKDASLCVVLHVVPASGRGSVSGAGQ
jgi:hypothetical protein